MIDCEAMATTTTEEPNPVTTSRNEDAESEGDADSTTVSVPMQVDPPTTSTKDPNSDEIVILEDDDNDDVENVPPKAGHSAHESFLSSASGAEAENTEKQKETEKVIKETKLMMQNLTRKELEEIVINRTIETVNSYSNMGCLRNKFLQLHATKDKLFQKSTSLQKQVNELTKAVRQLTENLNRNPKSGAKPNQPLRFFRSVGLQVGIELSAGKPQSIPRNLPRLEPLKNNDVKLVSSNKQIKPLHNNSVNGLVSIGQKRSYTIPAQQNNQQNNNTIILSRPNIVNHHSPAILNGGKNNLNNNENIENRPKNGIEVSQKINQGQQGQIVYGSNGELQVRLLNQSGVQILSGLQFVTNPGGGGGSTINNQNQAIRLPIQVSQTAVRSQVPGQIGLRQNTIGMRQPVHVVSQQQRPSIRPAIRPAYTQAGQQQVVIQQRTQTIQAQNRFILPALPPPHLSGQSQAMMARRGNKEIPPRPTLDLKEEQEGIVLSWNLSIGPNNAEINTYQLYACQEPLGPGNKNFPVAQWKRVGDVKALPLPMACTLSQFTDENRYHFIVRALDVYNRAGLFCEAKSIVLMKKRRR